MSKAETDVQFFSHLNGISLDNKWGEMINLLDTCLVKGLTLPNISDATITDDGRMTINFKSAHHCLLFQCVTLSGFSPSTFNDKYRIVGVPSTTQLLLSTDLTAQTATTVGTVVLSPLGYEIVFSANTKRVYRALNPTARHPFIRVDESRASADGTSVYADSYAKSAMVGLIENMTHIDDYEDPNKLQLPFDTSDFTKNWKISGTGENVVRGWSKWYWSRRASVTSTTADSYNAVNGNREFTLVGNIDAFFLINNHLGNSDKIISACGLYNKGGSQDWFLMSILNQTQALNEFTFLAKTGGTPLHYSQNSSTFHVNSTTVNIANSLKANAILPDLQSGISGIYNATNLAALEIPFSDENKYLRGTLNHIFYCGNNRNEKSLTPVLSDTSMFIYETSTSYNNNNGSYGGGFYFYLGEML